MNIDKFITDTIDSEFPGRIDYVSSKKLYCVKFRGELVVCNDGKITFLSVAAAKSSFLARYKSCFNTALYRKAGLNTNNYKEYEEKIKKYLLSIIQVEEYVT